MIKSGKHCGNKEKLLVLSTFFFCHYVFKKPSAVEASESVYMIRERVKAYSCTHCTSNFKKISSGDFKTDCHAISI